MTIGIFFGSFNPIHLGHIAIAERFLKEEELDEVWFSVSPHNPLKEKSDLLNTSLRVAMAKLATKGKPHIKVTDFEKDLPQPSYTYEALLYLKKQYPDNQIVLLIGGDNCGLFEHWRHYDKILDEFQVWAYPRSKTDINPQLAKKFKIIEAPLLSFASTDIRMALKKGGQTQGLPQKVRNFILKNHLYTE